MKKNIKGFASNIRHDASLKSIVSHDEYLESEANHLKAKLIVAGALLKNFSQRYQPK